MVGLSRRRIKIASLARKSVDRWWPVDSMERPTAAELELARALIAKVKAADPSVKKADELLVCAAKIAYRAGEFDKVPTACARAMGKEISRPKQVTDWVSRASKIQHFSYFHRIFS